MLPLVCDIPVVSNIKNKPHLEIVTYTQCKPTDNVHFVDLFSLLYNDKKVKPMQKIEVTTNTSVYEPVISALTEETLDDIVSDYDFVVKFSPTRTIKKKVFIKSVSKLSPKVII